MASKNTVSRVKTVLSLSALGLLITGGILYAGPLTPPAGPVTPSYKTLTEVEPRIAISLSNTPGDADSLFKITQPGSYYLTGNITGVTGKHGIKITSGDVSLDLNGFELAGIPGMGAFDGVNASGVSGLTVFNGTARGWGDEGIDLGTGSVSSSRVFGIRATGNSGNGITVGTVSTVTDCDAASNGAAGILSSGACTITNCTALSNGSSGISTSQTTSTVTNCTAIGNGTAGIAVNIGSVVTVCTASFNGTHGITAADGCIITNCTSRQNSGDGVRVESATTVQSCTLTGNNGDGIRADRKCIILSNLCNTNGLFSSDGAGIHITGSTNRLEGNTCSENDRGVDIDAAANIVVRNTCAANTTNWDIVIGNACLVAQVLRSGPITGLSGGASIGSTDPNANFSY